MKTQPNETLSPPVEDRDARLRLMSCSRHALRDYQWMRLQHLLERMQTRGHRGLPTSLPTQLTDWDAFRQLPFLRKPDLTPADGDTAAHHHLSAGEYTRLHRTSGTSGRPLIVMDTLEDWQWWMRAWQYNWDAADATGDDRAFFAFSFGPFVGFWSAFEAAAARGLQVIPAGGLGTAGRLDLLAATQANVLCCTPSYALHLAESALALGRDPRGFAVDRILVAGEPGGCIASTRQRIESAWDARLIDHAGATEIGPWGFGSQDGRDLVVIEAEFLAEFEPLSVAGSGQMYEPTADREPPECELILSNLDRPGSALLRYRTGDVVRPYLPDGDRGFVHLAGGIVSRVDDMIIIRGVNVFPTAIESILRDYPQLAEYKIIASRSGSMDELSVEFEAENASLAASIQERLAVDLGLRVPARCLPLGTLPRSSGGKLKRFEDRR